jgi:hypothetical protein
MSATGTSSIPCKGFVNQPASTTRPIQNTNTSSSSVIVLPAKASTKIPTVGAATKMAVQILLVTRAISASSASAPLPERWNRALNMLVLIGANTGRWRAAGKP